MRRAALLVSLALVALAAACADYATAPRHQDSPCSGYIDGSGRCIDTTGGH